MASESEKGVKKTKRVTIVYNDRERKSSLEGNLDGRARQESGATIRKGTDGNGERERQDRDSKRMAALQCSIVRGAVTRVQSMPSHPSVAGRERERRRKDS